MLYGTSIDAGINMYRYKIISILLTSLSDTATTSVQYCYWLDGRKPILINIIELTHSHATTRFILDILLLAKVF